MREDPLLKHTEQIWAEATHNTTMRQPHQHLPGPGLRRRELHEFRANRPRRIVDGRLVSLWDLECWDRRSSAVCSALGIPFRQFGSQARHDRLVFLIFPKSQGNVVLFLRRCCA
jgi:hypothetical protein